MQSLLGVLAGVFMRCPLAALSAQNSDVGRPYFVVDLCRVERRGQGFEINGVARADFGLIRTVGRRLEKLQDVED